MDAATNRIRVIIIFLSRASMRSDDYFFSTVNRILSAARVDRFASTSYLRYIGIRVC